MWMALGRSLWLCMRRSRCCMGRALCDLLREPGDGRSLNTSGTWCVEGVCVSHTTGRQGKGNTSTGKVSAFGTGEVRRRNLAWLNTLYNLQQVSGFLSEDKGTASSKSPFWGNICIREVCGLASSLKEHFSRALAAALTALPRQMHSFPSCKHKEFSHSLLPAQSYGDDLEITVI